MPTQLDNNWLPPETRMGGDGSVEGGPFDYGNGVYNIPRIHSQVFNGKHYDPITGNYGRYEYSINIQRLIEHYAVWAKQNNKELQKITDGKETITVSDLLWYLRYEQKTTVAGILGEKSIHNQSIIQFPTKLHPQIEIGHISHALMHAIKKAIDTM